MSDDLTQLDGISDNTAEYLHEEGFETYDDLHEASIDDLMEVKYMREGRAQDILSSVEETEEEPEDTEEEEAVVGETREGNYRCACDKVFYEVSVYRAHQNLCPDA